MGKRKCMNCGDKKPVEEGVVVGLSFFCGFGGAAAYAFKNKHKGVEIKRKAQVKKDKATRERLRTLAQWVKLCQDKYYNPYIRLRDKGKPCPSCRRFEYEVTEYTEGQRIDCGHYMSVGSTPELRFDERNARAQCRTCNRNSAKAGSSSVGIARKYTDYLIETEGMDYVMWLRGPHDAKRYRIDDIKILMKWYKRKAKRLRITQSLHISI